MPTTLKQAILAHAEFAMLALNNEFVTAIISGVKNLGVLNPKIPNAFVQGIPKTLSSKIRRGIDLPGISAFSVPIAQKYDYAGGKAWHFRAFRFLITPFDFDGIRMAVIDDVLSNGQVNSVLREILGEDWDVCISAIKEHLNRDVQSPFVDRSEPQIFWETGGYSVIVSPMADTLPVELAARLKSRRQAGQHFAAPLYFGVGGEQFQNSGVMAANMAGNLPKMMSLPPPTSRDVTPLPAPVDGHFLALEFECFDFNATGSGIAGGLGNVTAAIGFAEALRRKLDRAGVKIFSAGVAFGFSNVHFNGEYKNGGWHYRVKKGVRQNAKGESMPVAVAELTATARLHIVIRLSAPLSVADLGLVAPAVVSLRFAGGAIFNPVATVASDLDEILDDWGSQVWLVANRQQDIENAADRLDAALDRLQTNNPRYGLASIGFQGIEPPRPRNGLRDSSYRHIYAGGDCWFDGVGASGGQRRRLHFLVGELGPGNFCVPGLAANLRRSQASPLARAMRDCSAPVDFAGCR